jgi:hypothetical protein
MRPTTTAGCKARAMKAAPLTGDLIVAQTQP